MAKLFSYFIIRLIRLYQQIVSPYLPPACRFEPSCSSYVIIAIRTHGIWKGGRLGLKRICRCHPFARGGYDPVPPGKNCRVESAKQI